MKKYFLMMAMAVAALTMGVSSCSKDDDDNDGPAGGGYEEISDVKDDNVEIWLKHEVEGNDTKRIVFSLNVTGIEQKDIDMITFRVKDAESDLDIQSKTLEAKTSQTWTMTGFTKGQRVKCSVIVHCKPFGKDGHCEAFVVE